jgi:hypothetical protein
MARPRKFKARMTRTLTLRVPDELFDWVIEQAELNDGDLSETTRSALLKAQILDRVMSAPDPHVELQALIDESERQAAREAYFDKFGEYPDE